MPSRGTPSRDYLGHRITPNKIGGVKVDGPHIKANFKDEATAKKVIGLRSNKEARGDEKK